MYKSLVLITSLLNCSSSRSVFSRNIRFEQTKKTIESVKNNIPDACIILIDCTELTQEEALFFKENTNILLDCSSNESIKKAVYGHNKSEGERNFLLYAIDYIINSKEFSNCKNFFKISGRYWLDDKFDFAKYDNDMDVISTVDPNIWQNACVSCLFKLSFNNLEKFKNALVMYELQFLNGMCTESFLYNYVHIMKNEAFNLPILGCGGLIAVNGIEGHC